MLDIHEEFRNLVALFDRHKIEYAFSVVSRAGLIALKQFRSSGQDLDDIKALEEDQDA